MVGEEAGQSTVWQSEVDGTAGRDLDGGGAFVCFALPVSWFVCFCSRHCLSRHHCSSRSRMFFVSHFYYPCHYRLLRIPCRTRYCRHCCRNNCRHRQVTSIFFFLRYFINFPHTVKVLIASYFYTLNSHTTFISAIFFSHLLFYGNFFISWPVCLFFFVSSFSYSMAFRLFFFFTFLFLYCPCCFFFLWIHCTFHNFIFFSLAHDSTSVQRT